LRRIRRCNVYRSAIEQLVIRNDRALDRMILEASPGCVVPLALSVPPKKSKMIIISGTVLPRAPDHRPTAAREGEFCLMGGATCRSQFTAKQVPDAC